MISEYLIRISAPALRFYRNTLTLDFPEILQRVPEQGRLLDVGCFVGLATYEIARRRPGLEILGIDLYPRYIDLARRYNGAKNVQYDARRLQEVTGSYDCVMFSDVIHHVEPTEARAMLAYCQRILTPGGYVFVKEIARTRSGFAYFMDRYVHRTYPVYFYDPHEFATLLPKHFEILERFESYRFPFPHYYLKIRPKASTKNRHTVYPRTKPVLEP